MKLDPLKDLEVDVKDLTSEFKKLSLLLFRYYVEKADAEREYDRIKSTLKEIRASVYKQLKTSGEKHTEKSLEAEIDTNADVIKVQDLLLDAGRNLATWIGAVDSMKAKKDCLIQLGADRRAEGV